MIFTLLMSLFSLCLDLLAIMDITKSDEDLEIINLRQQVRILQRKVKTPRGYLIPKDNGQIMAFLIHDNDKKFTSSFDIVFSSEEIEIFHAP